jgi:serine/threonine protein kinase
VTSEAPSPDAQAKAASLPEPQPEEYPRTFGNYVLLAPLARGGMGEVFLAKSGAVAGLEKHCVVKTLRPHLTDDREYTTRFVDEARIVVKLGHKNICHVFDVGIVGERYYLAMEYVAGIDLRAVTQRALEAGAPLAPGIALHVVCEVLEALDYAHRHKDPVSGTPLLLVHRDVSPQNVMLSWEGEVKLIDFGLAASTMKMEQTSPNVVMGKLAYMSPEQVRGERVDGRADLFAAGVMLYEMLSGERFYDGHSPYEIWGLAAQGDFRPRAWEKIEPEIRAILDKALAGSVGARHATCSELREALEAYRFARGMRGDGPMLRALMQQTFEREIDESRKRLALLATAAPREVPLRPQEPTQSLARAPSSSSSRPAVSRPEDEATGPTKRMLVRARRGQQRSLALLGSIAVVVLLAVAGLAYMQGASRVGPAAPEPVVTTSPREPDPVVTTSTALAAPAEPPPQPREEPVVAAVKAADEPRVQKPKRKERQVEPAEPKVEEPPPAPPPPEAKPAVVDVKPRWSDLAWGGRVDALEQRCPSLACTKQALVHREDYAKISPEAFVTWREALQACWRACGLP